MMELIREHIDVIKIIGGILGIVAAAFYGYSRMKSRIKKERQPGDMLITTDIIGATVALIGLGIVLILWALDKTV